MSIVGCWSQKYKDRDGDSGQLLHQQCLWLRMWVGFKPSKFADGFLIQGGGCQRNQCWIQQNKHQNENSFGVLLIDLFCETVNKHQSNSKSVYPVIQQTISWTIIFWKSIQNPDIGQFPKLTDFTFDDRHRYISHCTKWTFRKIN